MNQDLDDNNSADGEISPRLADNDQRAAQLSARSLITFSDASNRPLVEEYQQRVRDDVDFVQTKVVKKLENNLPPLVQP